MDGTNMLPVILAPDRNFTLMQTQWKSQIDPVLNNMLVQGRLVQNQVLQNGQTVVNHKLGRTPQGWFLADINGPATVYRSADFNDLTLTLTSNAIVTVGIWVF